MKVKLSEAYRILHQLTLVSNVNRVDIKSLEEEVKTADSELYFDLNEFNNRIDNLTGFINSSQYELTKEDLIFLRIKAMNLQSLFSNLTNAIDDIFQKTDLWEKLE